MNAFTNKVALETFSSFDDGNKPSEKTHPERFYHGFVLGMTVNLADRYRVTSNCEKTLEDTVANALAQIEEKRKKVLQKD